MRRTIGAVAVVGVVLALLAAPASGAPDRKASGGGRTSAGWTLSFNGRDASPDRGQVQAHHHASGQRFHGDVACVVVGGNDAVLTGSLRGGGFFRVQVEDHGEGRGSIDHVQFEWGASPLPCTILHPAWNLVDGNAQVKS